MVLSNWSLLSRLRKVVKKVCFLLNFDENSWRAASMIGSPSIRRLSFNNKLGLRGCTDDSDHEEMDSSHGLHRTRSFIPDEDIDKRADMFIAKFYQQLQIERQVSLELQYCRGKSLERTRSD